MSDVTILTRKDGTCLFVLCVKDRLRRLRILREVKAPRWIIKQEQVLMIQNRIGVSRQDLIDKFVSPIMGQGSITVPDNGDPRI